MRRIGHRRCAPQRVLSAPARSDTSTRRALVLNVQCRPHGAAKGFQEGERRSTLSFSAFLFSPSCGAVRCPRTLKGRMRLRPCTATRRRCCWPHSRSHPQRRLQPNAVRVLALRSDSARRRFDSIGPECGGLHPAPLVRVAYDVDAGAPGFVNTRMTACQHARPATCSKQPGDGAGWTPEVRRWPSHARTQSAARHGFLAAVPDNSAVPLRRTASNGLARDVEQRLTLVSPVRDGGRRRRRARIFSS